MEVPKVCSGSKMLTFLKQRTNLISGLLTFVIRQNEKNIETLYGELLNGCFEMKLVLISWTFVLNFVFLFQSSKSHESVADFLKV